MKRSQSIAYLFAIICCATAAALAPFAGRGGGSFDLSWHTIGGGGGSSTGGGFELAGTIGQPDAGATMTGSTFALTGGFWAITGGAIPRSCPWDLDDDGNVGTADLILLLGSWGDPYGAADLIELLGSWGPCPK